MDGSNNYYYLMHEDDIVLTMEIEPVSGSIVKVGKQINRELVPPGANLSVEHLKKWWKNRSVPITQGHIKRILAKAGITTPEEYLVHNYGLSLTDHYWIKPVNFEINWNSINLFTNDFKDEIGDLQFSETDYLSQEIDLIGKTTFYPSASLQGDLQKKWIIQNGDRYLVKGNYGHSSQQSMNEIFASEIHRRQEKHPFVNYVMCNLETFRGRGIGCICKDFASQSVEFISAYDFSMSVKKNNEDSEYEHFIQVATMNGLDSQMVRSFLEYQILTDFLITNTDRHFNNFGVLRDAKTLRYIGMAPVFDSGNSMFYMQPNYPLHNDLLDITVNSFKRREVDLLSYVTDFSLIDMNRLPGEAVLRSLYAKDSESDQYLDGICAGYLRKIQLFEKVASGDKIWKYGYK